MVQLAAVASFPSRRGHSRCPQFVGFRHRGFLTVHLINPSDFSFGIGVITPRWLYVLAGRDASTIRRSRSSPTKRSNRSTRRSIRTGDVVGIGIHTGNALRGYEIGRAGARAGARSCSAASTRRCFPRRRTSWRRPRRRQGRWRSSSGRRCSMTRAGRAAARSTKAGASSRRISCRRAGI